MASRRTTQVELPLGLQSYRNTALFSDHFLTNRLPEMAFYRRRGRAATTRAAFDAISKVFRDVDPETTLANSPEAQCEEDIIKPVLRALGHPYLVQPPTETGKRTKNFPDYAMFRNETDKDAARTEVHANDYHRSTGVAEGKHWDRNLDKSIKTDRDALTNANPSYQIVAYLNLTGRRWGILTNGRLWRLYCRDAPQPLERFFEIDLLRTLRESGEQAFFHLFYGLFSAEAFAPRSGGQTHLDEVLRGAIDNAEDIGAGLRVRIFTALQHLAAGFLRGRTDTITVEELDDVYDNSLVVLYRLLFVLYAEARELLPLEGNASYADQLSLSKLVREIEDTHERNRTYSATSTVMWSRLQGLWTAIDKGDTDLDVPEYDGELFAEGGHPYLDSHQLPDQLLANAIDLLARVPGEMPARFVDYRSLSVAHLGTVYEGLLEHSLAVVEGDGAIEHRVRLAPTRARRRETGSYYTPDPVVQHIVRETLGPLIEGKTEEEILSIRVVDPAMGSGHFLVAAVEFLAVAIATARGEEEDYDPDDLTDIKRRVIARCIYGVDLNPLAVELAKLSLWLATANTNRPLTFLDHRLRIGNSVLALRPEDLAGRLKGPRGKRTAQMTVFEQALATQHTADVQLAGQIDAITDDDMPALKLRKQLHAGHEANRARLRRLMDAGVHLAFGLIDVNQVADLAAALPASEEDWRQAVDDAAPDDLPLDDDLRPFHWELEFPEVFEAGGFDVVLGNPPYVNAWDMTQAAQGLRDALRNLGRWETVAKGHWDLFVLFVALGMQVLRDDGLFGIIVANPLMREKYAEAVRGELLQGTILSIVDFGDHNVFEGVARETVVMVWRKTAPPPLHEVVLHDPEGVLDIAA